MMALLSPPGQFETLESKIEALVPELLSEEMDKLLVQLSKVCRGY